MCIDLVPELHQLQSGRYVNILRTRVDTTWGKWESIRINRKNQCCCQWIQSSLIDGNFIRRVLCFYADAPCATKVICNPAMNIAEHIRSKIGFGTYSYLVERQDGNAEYILDETICRRFTEYEISHKAVSGTKNYALFAVHDEFIVGRYAWQYGNGFRIRLQIIVGFQRRT